MSNTAAVCLILFSTSLMVGSGALWTDALNGWQVFCVAQLIIVVIISCTSVGMRQDKERGVKPSANRRIRR